MTARAFNSSHARTTSGAAISSVSLGKPVDVVVKVHRNKRSDKQNAWWWTVPIPLIAAEVGYDKHEHEMLHYALVAKCFGTVWDDRMKQEIPERPQLRAHHDAVL
jgi:hypothetical protein